MVHEFFGGLFSRRRVVMQKYCPKCKRNRDTKHFFGSPARGDNLSSYCKPCNTQKGREWCAVNRKRKNENELNYRLKFPLRHMLYRARTTAKRRGWKCNLTEKDIQDLFVEFCPILGIRLNYDGQQGRPGRNSASLDRVDSTKGYLRGNVAIISDRANSLKNDGTADEHRRVAAYMEAHQ